MIRNLPSLAACACAAALANGDLRMPFADHCPHHHAQTAGQHHGQSRKSPLQFHVDVPFTSNNVQFFRKLGGAGGEGAGI